MTTVLAQLRPPQANRCARSFALNLEYLEAQFHAFAANGTSLAASQLTGTGTQGAAAGGRAVAQPALDIGVSPTSAFSGAARAAGLTGPTDTFDPYTNDENFLRAACIFEDVGSLGSS